MLPALAPAELKGQLVPAGSSDDSRAGLLQALTQLTFHKQNKIISSAALTMRGLLHSDLVSENSFYYGKL